MKLEFGDLEIGNFKCFVHGHILPLHDYGVGLHFVRGRNEDEPRLGPNGAGKSTLWDALSWVLYGKTPDGSRNPDIRPWRSNERTHVGLDLKVGGKKHVVIRTADPNTLTLDGVPVGQEQIDGLLGLSFGMFTNTVLLGQGQPLFFDLKPAEKMALFSDTLGLDKWEARSQAAHARAGELETQRAMVDGAIAAEEAALEDLWSLRDDLEAQAKEWAKEQRKKQKVSGKELEGVKKKLAGMQARHDKVSTQYDWVCVEIKGTNADLDRLRSTTAPGRSLQLTATRLQKELDEVSDVCPTCGQQIDPKSLGKHRSEVRVQLKEIKDALKVVARAEKQEEALREALAGFRANADLLYLDMEQAARSIAELKAEKTQIEKALAEKEEEINPYHEQAQTMRKRISKAKAELTESKEILERLVRRIERAKFWVKGFKDVRLYLIEEVLQELELATNAVLDDVGLIGWKVGYSVEKETKSGTMQRGLNVMITSPGLDRRVRWESFSGGESQRLRIVGSLALSEVLLGHMGVDPSLEVLDEPAHFMAADGVRDLVDYLATRAQGIGRSTFFVDHMALESSRFSSVTTVVKQRGGEACIESGME